MSSSKDSSSLFMPSPETRQVLSKSTRILNQVYGADKIFRAGVYIPKFLALLILRSQPNNEVAQKLQIFANQFNMARTVNRFFGTLDSIEMAISAMEVDDPLSKIIAHVQAWSMILYHPLEHIYWFNAVGIWKSVDGDAASRYSCMAWLLYILLDIFNDLRLLKQWIQQHSDYKRSQQKQLSSSSSSSFVSSDPSSIGLPGLFLFVAPTFFSLSLPRFSSLEPSPSPSLGHLFSSFSLTPLPLFPAPSYKNLKNIVLRTIKNLSDAPMALHWSVETPVLSPLTLNFLGVVGSVVGLHYKWINS
jgi:hypothetical protein